MLFYDRLIAETEKERTGFTSIPLIREAVRSGASRELYVDFLTQAYHHVKHTFPQLAFAASRTSDDTYQDASRRIYGGGARAREMDPQRHRGHGRQRQAVRDGASGHRLPGNGGLHLLRHRVDQPLCHARQRACA